MFKRLFRQIRRFLSNLINSVYISIRVKLALVSLTLLSIPFIGYQYIQEMEQYLRQDQEAALLENARIVAAVLEDYPKIFHTSSPASNNPPAKEATTENLAGDPNQSELIEIQEVSKTPTHHIFIRSLRSPILLDGYVDDWIFYRERTLHYSANSNEPDAPNFRFSVGRYQRYVYALFQVKDKNLVFRKANSSKVDANDHLQIALHDKKGRHKRYILSSYTQGNMSVHQLISNRNGTRLKPETRIAAFFLQTNSGYNIELRIPLSMLGDQLSFGVADVDDRKDRESVTLLTTSQENDLSRLSSISFASPAVDLLLNRIKSRFTRIWVVDQSGNILAMSGQLTESEEQMDMHDDFVDISLSEAMLGIVRLFYSMILKQPAKEFQDDLSAVSRLNTTEIAAALKGRNDTQWRLTPDARVNILTATAPVVIEDEVSGAVAVEQTSNSILLLQNRAVEILINLSILTMFLALFFLLGFATRLSIRIRQLRNQTENAIGEDGRIQGKVIATNAADELGDLSRSFDNMLSRLSQYNRYLETMASKLSHEFRTPITVVKSSLDNLELGNLDEQTKAYTERAREGIERLNNILTRMSEATRLEQTLQSEHCENFDLEKVVSGCVKGYSLARPEQKFHYELINEVDKAAIIHGTPDLIAQQLDKLISNACSFAEPETSIDITLSVTEREILLSVENKGPLLPEQMQHTLFESMVSIRDKKGDEPHLGLGLYIVRLIAEFHNARLHAANTADRDGVVFIIAFPHIDFDGAATQDLRQ